jgi:hypothetical protein
MSRLTSFQTPDAKSRPDDMLVLKASRTGAAKAFGLIAVVSVVGGVRYLNLGSPTETVGHMIFGSFLLLIVLLPLSYFGYRVVRPGVAVVLDAEGIKSNASTINPGPVYWSEIASAEVCKYGLMRHLRIYLRDPETVLERQPAWKRAVFRSGMALGSSPVEIPETLLPMSVDELLDILVKRGVNRTGIAGGSSS